MFGLVNAYVNLLFLFIGSNYTIIDERNTNNESCRKYTLKEIRTK